MVSLIIQGCYRTQISIKLTKDIRVLERVATKLCYWQNQFYLANCECLHSTLGINLLANPDKDI